ncbi:DUF1835 domain-containing protein [Pseudalkalibacillus caeni]|nr:DUF1835 domain-containing protein [Pseudalkalibacillus caeni]
MLHITNGDILAEKLSFLEHERLPWREMYDFGPVFKVMGEKELSKRAAYFEQTITLPLDLYLANTERQEERLIAIEPEEEIVLWFEHDRYDQLMLLYLLNRLGTLHKTNVSMVLPEKYVTSERFFSLSQLTEQELENLFQERKKVSIEQFQQAEEGWEAFSSSNPKDLLNFIHHKAIKLPFLKQAILSHFDYFPSERNGLTSIEEETLKILADGKTKFLKLFESIASKRRSDGLSDLHFSAILKQLSKTKSPLIKVHGILPDFSLPEMNPFLELTEEGEEVLRAEKDRFDCLPFNWWLGGVHLQDGTYRWNGEDIIVR